MITGTTTHKLDQIRTYNPTTPYVVGTNGVTAFYTDVDGNDVVEYTIGTINYKTTLIESSILPRPDIPDNIALNLNNPNTSNKQFIPRTGKPQHITFLDTSHYPTTFSYSISAITEDSYFVFKDEAKMGVVFTPKVYEDVFIERQRMSIFESQSRLGVIVTLEDLEEYNNGYYNIVKTE